MLVIAGGFTSIWAAGDREPSTRNGSRGSIPTAPSDSEFNPNANNAVTALAVQRDGKLLLGGSFSTLHPLGEENPPATRTSRGSTPMARSTVISTRRSTATSPPSPCSPTRDPRRRVRLPRVRLRLRLGAAQLRRALPARWRARHRFRAHAQRLGRCVRVPGRGKFVLGGQFTRATPLGGTTALVRNRLARLNADGSLDTHFELDAAAARCLDHAGSSAHSQDRHRRLVHQRRRRDPHLPRPAQCRWHRRAAYKPELNGRFYRPRLRGGHQQGDHRRRIHHGRRRTRNHLARLNASGTIDSEFNPNIRRPRRRDRLQSDGASWRRHVHAVSSPSAQPRRPAAPISSGSPATGTLETPPSNPSPNSSVSAIAPAIRRKNSDWRRVSAR